MTHFRSVNACLLKNWHEVRLRGKFMRILDKHNRDNQVVMSRWHYKVTVEKKTSMVIGIH